MQQDRPLVGIALMTGFCIAAPMGDAFAKILGAMLPLGVLLLIRFLFQGVLLLPLAALLRRDLRLGPRLLRLTLIRTVLHIAGIGMMFEALRYLPLADAIAIAFVMPFILLLLGYLLLGEEVGPHRLSACAVGFLGTLLVIQPNFTEVGLPALLPLGVALNFALFILTTRAMAKEVDAIAMQGISGLMAIVILGVILAFGPDWPMLELSAPPAEAWPFILGMGLIGSFGHLLMTWSLRFAPAATLAPIQYLEIPVSTLIGYLVFRDLPDGLAAVGIAVTIGAGLYIVQRERNLSRRQASPLPPAPPAS
ncbi:DMT family transporter [Histidinibacterium aquaticum]|uniref:DMT family transporter n=1 Tax=Histidinibacterium aquaticum TaxID=2613962 RepID=A0A5J5GK56_9RHOB|nr:DMT family transporter [Histidinibacterium aquaticum]KAA9007934.1 DMT family transporter [Histidinibacterium aquaticum]